MFPLKLRRIIVFPLQLQARVDKIVAIAKASSSGSLPGGEGYHRGTEGGGGGNDGGGSALQMKAEIAGVRDVFPELGEGFVLACLEAYGGSVERVVGCLLEGSLSGDLNQMSRDTPLPAATPKQSMLAGRLNVFDGDEFDVFGGGAVDVGRIKVRDGRWKGDVADGDLDRGGGDEVRARTLAGVVRMQLEECKREMEAAEEDVVAGRYARFQKWPDRSVHE